MSKLEFYKRSIVAFDPANAEHRKWVNNFHDKSSWSGCPIRFEVPEDRSGTDVPTVIKRMLLKYYMDQEFNQVTESEKAPL